MCHVNAVCHIGLIWTKWGVATKTDILVTAVLAASVYENKRSSPAVRCLHNKLIYHLRVAPRALHLGVSPVCRVPCSCQRVLVVTSTDGVQPNSSEVMLKCSQPQTLCCQETAPARREFGEHIADGENRFWRNCCSWAKSQNAQNYFFQSIKRLSTLVCMIRVWMTMSSCLAFTIGKKISHILCKCSGLFCTVLFLQDSELKFYPVSTVASSDSNSTQTPSHLCPSFLFIRACNLWL